MKSNEIPQTIKVINSVRKRFTQIPNPIVVDPSISDGAYRVFSYVSTKPDNWLINNRDIQNKLNIKRAETIAKYWKELINSGWVSRQPIINANGKPSGYFDYVLNFEPIKPIPQNAEVVKTDLQNAGTPHNPYTVNQQLRKNRSYTNTEISNNKEDKNPPISPKVSDTPEFKGGDFGVAQKVKQLNFDFSASELNSIQNWFSYASQRSRAKSIPHAQVSALLQILQEHKSNGYDITNMITRSIGNGYAGVMSPTKEFLVNKSQTSAPTKTGRYKSVGYITPENKSQKNDLRNYLERCYLHDKVDPRTNEALSSEQKNLFKLHLIRCKAKHLSVADYIFQNEVLTGVCLLDQPLDGADASTKPVAA